jgi:adenine-specific DNA methylase
MTTCKKLIEVAMPVKEISAESVRDKSIRHGHISTLHLWWARRPLPVCRAVVFASLVYDPLDENCPEQFKNAVKKLLTEGHYRPYDDIPFTAAKDPLEDNLRNRLIAFIGKFSDKYIECEEKGKKCPSKEQLSPFSLIKWESKNNEDIITIARKLIWVAHDPENNTLGAFDSHFKAIKDAEKELYGLKDRHVDRPEVAEKQTALDAAIKAFLDRMPRVFDPFAGGGAIPLEAARLGCNSYANDLNPVAHIIEKASLEFPQKYGKPIVYSKDEFIKLYGDEAYEELDNADKMGDDVHIKNRLAFDVEYYCKKMLALAEKDIGHLYPAVEEEEDTPQRREGRKGKEENNKKSLRSLRLRGEKKPIAYYWARVGTCANPSCGAKVPLLKGFYLCNKTDKKVHLKPVIEGTEIRFEIRKGTIANEGWVNRGNFTCPCCNNVTDVKILKQQNINGQVEERLLAVIEESKNGKAYRLPDEKELQSTNDIPESYRPHEEKERNSAGGDTHSWGVTTWGQMFTNRQLLALNTFVEKLKEIEAELTFEEEYMKAVVTYLAVLVDRVAPRQTSFGIWDVTRETVVHPFGRQAIPMVFDYPESNPFCTATGSAFNQIDWMVRFIKEESYSNFAACASNAASGDALQFKDRQISACVTDPPYYDAIAYADLSDFFYVWLKRILSSVFPESFAYPLTPKSSECTALKHHHSGNVEQANRHFENKLLDIFTAIEQQMRGDGVVTVMFAHQSTAAWSTLCHSILSAKMNIFGSWCFDSEMNTALKRNKAFLASSVTVSCRPSQRTGIGSFREVKSAIESTVRRVVKELYTYGFRGADLLTACFGFAVSEFGKFEKVEKASGDEVTVQELLEMAREAAFNAIISDINTDDATRFYIGWLNLFGFTDAEHDDVRRITQIGLDVDVNKLLHSHILIRHGNKQSLAPLNDRIAQSAKLGLNATPLTIDRVHRAMHLYGGVRGELVAYIAERAPSAEDAFWRTVNALAEVLPAGSNDHKLAAGLAANKESLLREARQRVDESNAQTSIFE